MHDIPGYKQHQWNISHQEGSKGDSVPQTKTHRPHAMISQAGNTTSGPEETLFLTQ